MRTILCVWLPEWPLQRFAAAHGELKGKAVLLYEAPGRGGLQVAAYASPDGKSFGIRAGMPVAEAIALYECGTRVATRGKQARPQDVSAGHDEVIPLHLEAYDPLADRLALEQLAEWCQRFSPTVALEEAERPESLLLDVTGLAGLFGGETVLVRQIAAAFQNRGFATRIALAGTVGAAWALAHYGEMADAEQLPKPEILPSLPLSALRLPGQTVELLGGLGIHQIGQLAALPRSTLSSRFGTLVLKRLDQATGAAGEVVVAQKLPPELEAEWPLEHATDRLETIEFVLDQLISRLAEVLGRQRQGIVQFECRLNCLEAEPVRLALGLYRPSASGKHLLELVRLRLETLRLPAPVSAIRVSVTAKAPLELNQQEMFAEDRGRESPRHLASLVDRLSSRLGRDRVLRCCLLPDAQPEYACQYLPLAGAARRSDGRRGSRRVAPRHSCGPCERPLQLCCEPLRLSVVSIAPDGPPVQFRHRGRDQRITTAWGPERIETGWWRHRCLRRDYYRVETTTGHRYWLFRQLDTGHWWLAGTF